jgi:hypothetical protein
MPFRQARVLSNSFQHQASSRCGAAAVGAGIRSPLTGAGGEEDGFRPIARRRTVITAGGFPMMAGETPIVGEAVTVPTTIGARSHIPIGAGEVPPVAGVIRSPNQAGLASGYLGRGLFFDVGSRAPEKIPKTVERVALTVSGVPCTRLHVLAIFFARLALR